MSRDRDAFSRQFEGPELLEALLEAAGSILTLDEVVERMKEAAVAGEAPAAVIPSFFAEEPRFADPAMARQLYQNLLGLWDLLAAGKPLPARARREQSAPDRVKRARVEAPSPWGSSGPTPEFVQQAAALLQGDLRSRERLLHAFENRQDSLLTHLDELPLSDGAYLLVRGLIADLHAMLELGEGRAPGTLDPSELTREDSEPAELAPLWSHADEAIGRAERAPAEGKALSVEEAQLVRTCVRRTLRALWVVRAKGR